MLKKCFSVAIALILALTMVFLTSCGKSEFGSSENDNEKAMTITAENAGEGDFFMKGTLEVAKGEQIVIEPSLEKGSVELDFISAEGMDDIEEMPDTDAAESLLKAQVSGTEQQAYKIKEGPYMVKATVTEKATGTIRVSVTAAEAQAQD